MTAFDMKARLLAEMHVFGDGDEYVAADRIQWLAGNLLKQASCRPTALDDTFPVSASQLAGVPK
jgi:hypothetical protein